MNYAAASSEVSLKALNAPRGGELNPTVIKFSYFINKKILCTIFEIIWRSKEMVQDARNLRLHDAIISNAKIQYPWQKHYFGQPTNFIKDSFGNRKFRDF